jgi:hypothetical protein
MKLSDYLKEIDVTPTIVVGSNLGNGISRTEIETAITDAGYDLPTENILFYIVDTTKAWQVRYFKALDKYGVKKFTMK